MTQIGVNKCWNGILFSDYEIGIGINFYYLKFFGFQSLTKFFKNFAIVFKITLKDKVFQKHLFP